MFRHEALSDDNDTSSKEAWVRSNLWLADTPSVRLLLPRVGAFMEQIYTINYGGGLVAAPTNNVTWTILSKIKRQPVSESPL